MAWLVCIGGAYAQEPAHFGLKDWALQCDNTRTCRAVGYQAEEGDSDPVSMRITRAAGPATPIAIDVQVYSEKDVKSPVQLRVGSFVLQGMQGESFEVPASRVQALLPELLKADVATVRTTGQTWTLSLSGATAVLLKMDDVQGRVGTPGAIVKRGTRAESSVLPAISAPTVRAVTPLKNKATDASLAAAIWAAMDKKEAQAQCNDHTPALDEISIYRLTADKVLLSLPCAMGAYNYSYLGWMARDKLPYRPQFLEADGEFDPATGTLTSSMKGRGIGDCWSYQTWQFDGQGFTLTDQRSDEMCRGFPGGAWQLPSYVTQTVRTPPTSTQPKQ